MKLTNIILAGLLAAAPVAFGQATSKVVGYETLTVNSGFNYLGLRLLEQTVASGTVASVSAANVTLDAAPTVDTGVYLFEITSGTAAGTVIEIDSVADTIVTLTADLSAELAAGDSYSIRPAHTLASVFGDANSAGLNSAATFGGCDQIWLPDGAGDFVQYAYLAGNARAGTVDRWVDSDLNDVDATSIVLNYTDGVIVNAQSTGSFIVSGEVKTTSTSIALTNTFNYLGSVYPAGSTIETAFGASNSSGLLSVATFGGCDQIWLPNSSGDFDKYAYLAGNARAGTVDRWVDSDSVDVDPSTIELTSGAILVKNDADKNIVVSQPSSYDTL